MPGARHPWLIGADVYEHAADAQRTPNTTIAIGSLIFALAALIEVLCDIRDGRSYP